MAINKKILDRSIEVLNRMLQSDPDATNKLFKHRVTCNTAISEDSDIQVGIYDYEQNTFKVGIMGVINGIIGSGSDGWGGLCMMPDEDENIVKFLKYKKE